jgi:hypothetical protein
MTVKVGVEHATMKQDVSPAARPLDTVAAALAVALCLSWASIKSR